MVLGCPAVILHADDDANRALYGREVSLGEVLGGAVRPPPEWRPFVYELRGLDLAMDPNRQMSIPRTSTHAHSPSFPGGLTPPSEGSRTTRRTGMHLAPPLSSSVCARGLGHAVWALLWEMLQEWMLLPP